MNAVCVYTYRIIFNYPVGFIQVGITALANLTAATHQKQCPQGSPLLYFDLEEEVQALNPVCLRCCHGDVHVHVFV